MSDKTELDRKTTPPRWCPNAVLESGGWKDPNTGEILVGRRVTQEEIDHFNNKNKMPQAEEKHTQKPIETPDNVEETTTETLTPDEQDKRDLLEETPGDVGVDSNEQDRLDTRSSPVL